MLIGLIATGTLAGLLASLLALVSGAGLLMALAIYAGTGAGLVLLLAGVAALSVLRDSAPASSPATTS